MNGSIVDISGRECHLYKDSNAEFLLVQPIDEHDLEVLGQEVEIIKELSDKPFTLAAFMIKDWNQELTPWSAPAVFGRTPFGDGASNTLRFISSQLLPSLTDAGIYDTRMRLLLGGYSLAGLFALWSAYHTNIFDGIAAASPSVWFPKWIIDYATEKRPLAKSVYLSLGDKEDRTKNLLMAQVGNAIRKQHELLMRQRVNTILEWNAGNHFMDSERRMAKGFAWLLNNQK